MDIQSAYDTVWHNGLIYKLKEYFLIEGNFLIWIANYLVIGYNRVILDGYYTEWMQVRIGVKQGCPLSPLLWSIYINDFEAYLKMAAFADDITIFNVYNCMSLEYSYQLQDEIDRFFDWTLYWRLKISTTKCNSLTLTRKRNFKARVYTINNETLDCVHHPNNAPFVCMHNLECEEYYSIHMKDNINCMIDTIAEFDDNDIVNEIYDDFLEEFINYENESNGTILDYNDNNINEPSQWQMNVSQNHSIPLCVRILGLFFDPKLNWTEQIKTVIGRCKGKIYKLAKIAYHKDFNLSPFAIYKLYLSTIRPSIEYAFSVYSGSNKFELLQRLQNTAVRLCLRQRSCAPNLFLNETMNVISIQQRLELAQVKLWNHYIRAPKQLIKNQIIHEWQEKTGINGSNEMMQFKGNYNLKNRNVRNYGLNNLKFIKNTAISRMYNLVNELNEMRKENDLKPLQIFNFKKDIFKAAPMYKVEYPTNLVLFCDMNAYYEGNEIKKLSGALVIYKENYNEKYIRSDTKLNDRKELNARMKVRKRLYGNVSFKGKVRAFIQPKRGILDLFTDGSCKPNPGPGGCAIYCPQFKQFNTKYVITHATTINYAELVAIEQVLLIVKENCGFLRSNRIFEISIFTDSTFVMNNMHYNNVNEIKYYYDLIEEIFIKMNDLKEFKFNIIKIEAHVNIKENEVVDKMAKEAANEAKEMEANEGNSPWKNEDTPAIVIISMFNELITEKYSRIKVKKWKQYKEKLEKRRKETEIFEDDVYMNEQLFMKAMFKMDDSKVLNKNGKYLFQEMRCLNAVQSEIIMKLRTETAHLNYFLAKQYKLPDTNGTCLNCGVIENVTHYLLDCAKYQKQRDRLKYRLLFSDKRNIPVEYFRNQQNWTAINLLFPHYWQVKPNPEGMKKDEYKEIMEKLCDERVKVLSLVAVYVRETKRFESDIGI